MKAFCEDCRKEVSYRIQFKSYKKRIKEKDYNFTISEAVCEECGNPVSVPGMLDRNAQEIDRQYRFRENIISMGEIRDLEEMYGRERLAVMTGIDTSLLQMYIDGRVPSKEHSELLRKI